MKKGLLSAERVKLMESWEHSGFNIDASVRIGAEDTMGRENLARYLIRAPFSAEKITCNVAASMVIYEARRATGANGHFESFDPLDCLAAGTSCIPNRGEHLVHYYGYHSKVQRGRHRRQDRERVSFGPVPFSDDGVVSLDTILRKT